MTASTADHAFEPENINRSIIRAGCSCGWQAPAGRRKVLAAVDDWEFHVTGAGIARPQPIRPPFEHGDIDFPTDER